MEVLPRAGYQQESALSIEAIQTPKAVLRLGGDGQVACDRRRRYNSPAMSFSQRLLLAGIVLLFDFVVFFLPLAAIIVAYVLVVRPAWFPGWIENLYRDQH